MGIRHALVESIKEETADRAARYGGSDNFFATKIPLDPNDMPRLAMVNGLAVPKELGLLCDEMRKVYPHIQFGINANCSATWVGETLACIELWGYLPNDVYAPIRVGFSDYRVKKNDEKQPTYGVYARSITNQKFQSGREQYYMIMSDKLDKALTAVRTHLRAYRLGEIAKRSNTDYHVEARDGAGVSRRRFHRAQEDVVSHVSFINELQHMISSGHTFVDGAFKNAVLNMLEAKDMYDKEEHRVHYANFVLVREQDGGQVFDVMRNLEVGRSDALDKTPVETFTETTLPEDIAGKIAALSMLQTNNYVDGLGMRVSNITYWVAV
jgi:hypothetical protein